MSSRVLARSPEGLVLAEDTGVGGYLLILEQSAQAALGEMHKLSHLCSQLCPQGSPEFSG